MSEPNVSSPPLTTPTLFDDLHQAIAYYRIQVLLQERQPVIAHKINAHLLRFAQFCQEQLAAPRLSVLVRRDVLAFQKYLRQHNLAPSTINNILASISGFCSFVMHHQPQLFAGEDPSKKIPRLTLPPLEPRALTVTQVQSLKSLCDRLPRLHQRRGRRITAYERRSGKPAPLHAWARPYRDRALIFVLLSTGLRREELVNLRLHHFGRLNPLDTTTLRQSRNPRLFGVHGKGQTMRTVFLSADARTSIADYVDREWGEDLPCHFLPLDRTHYPDIPLFLSAKGIPARQQNGSLSLRAVNLIVTQIGQWHDAQVNQSDKQLAPLRPHDLRHTFAFLLAKATGNDSYELQRRLGHRSQRYIERYTNPPEDVAAAYIENF